MGKSGALGRSVPVFLACRNENDIPGDDRYLFVVRSYNTLAFSNEQYLFNSMAMKLVLNAPVEMDLSGLLKSGPQKGCMVTGPLNMGVFIGTLVTWFILITCMTASFSLIPYSRTFDNIAD
jgi:hypothetical protein